MKLTISMATYDDYCGVFFSMESLRIHQKLPKETEFIVLDNNPDSDHGRQVKHFSKSVPNMRVIDVTDRQSSFVKYDVFKHAEGDVILGLDCQRSPANWIHRSDDGILGKERLTRHANRPTMV